MPHNEPTTHIELPVDTGCFVKIAIYGDLTYIALANIRRILEALPHPMPDAYVPDPHPANTSGAGTPNDPIVRPLKLY